MHRNVFLCVLHTKWYHTFNTVPCVSCPFISLFYTHSIHLDITQHPIDGLVLDCSISSALALEILQSCSKPLKCNMNPQVSKYYPVTPFSVESMTQILLHTLGSEQNGWYVADNIFKYIFFNANQYILIQFYLKIVPSQIDNTWTLVQVMAWYH